MHLNPFAYTEFPQGCAVEFPAGVKVSWVLIPTSRILRI